MNVLLLILFLCAIIIAFCGLCSRFSNDLYWLQSIVPSKKGVWYTPAGVYRGIQIKQKQTQAEIDLVGTNPKNQLYPRHSDDESFAPIRMDIEKRPIDIYGNNYNYVWWQAPRSLGYGPGPSGDLRPGFLRKMPYFYPTSGTGQSGVVAKGDIRTYPYESGDINYEGPKRLFKYP